MLTRLAIRLLDSQAEVTLRRSLHITGFPEWDTGRLPERRHQPGGGGGTRFQGTPDARDSLRSEMLYSTRRRYFTRVPVADPPEPPGTIPMKRA